MGRFWFQTATNIKQIWLRGLTSSPQWGSLKLLPRRLKVQKSGGEIVFTLKAYNGRVVTEWLAHCLADAASKPHDDERIPMTHVAMMLRLNGNMFFLCGLPAVPKGRRLEVLGNEFQIFIASRSYQIPPVCWGMPCPDILACLNGFPASWPWSEV